MGLKPGYKQTEVGVIPEEWEVEPLGSVGHWFSGGTPSMANDLFWSGEIPWVSAKDMKVARLRDSLLHVTEKAIGNGTRLAPPGAVLMVVRGMILAHTLPVAVATRPVAFNQDMKALVTRAGIDSEFILLWLQSNAQRILEIASEATHGTKRIPSEDLFSMKIALPPPPEQRAIAGALSEVDALIGALDQLIAKKRDLKQAAMQQLLTDQKRLPGFHGEWETGQLRSFVRSHNSGVYKKSELYGKGCNIVGVSDLYGIDCVDGQHFAQVPLTAAEQAKHTLETNDLLYSESSLVREGIARTVYVTERGAGTAFAWHTRRYSVDQNVLLSSYLYYYLQGRASRKHMMDQSIQTAITGINTAAYFGCPVLIPPLPEQTAIAEVLSDMDAELAALDQRRDKTRALKQGMMQELLTGRTRLPVAL